ncbi:unnamed protein product [Phytophthora fragariaefolia]|uniref:Elicitin n=1 Tax=Phytophthora fragariaefolia TaxID=1490495 RepID=A0A9W6TX93_9STRA|nr:unnamed protein product [Phytophthora fragariaefolia]
MAPWSSLLNSLQGYYRQLGNGLPMRLAAIAVVSLTSISAVEAGYCTETQFQSMSSNSHVGECTEDAGFAIISKLTANQIKKICASSACIALWRDVQALGSGDCTFPGQGISLQTDILNPVWAECGAARAPAILSTSSSTATETESGKNSLINSSPASRISIAHVSLIALLLLIL